MKGPAGTMTYKQQQRIVTILFLLVPMLLLVVFGYLPIINMLQYSFTNWDGLTQKQWVGLDNYKTLFTREENYRVFGTSLYYFVGSFIQLALALYFATVLSFKTKFANFFKGVLFFPNLINGVAIGFIFLYFFRDTGTLNTLLRLMGLDALTQLWLTNPHLINYSLTGVSIWRYLGFNMVLFLGAIQSISTEIFEATELDGASKWQQFRYVIFPSIRPIVYLNLILAIKGSLSVFETPYIMTGGGNGSMTFVIRTVDTAFKFSKFGLGSSMAIVLTVLILVVTAAQNAIFKEKE
jgi:raffinose/stachyose/melibiose transport system permease protein